MRRITRFSAAPQAIRWSVFAALAFSLTPHCDSSAQQPAQPSAQQPRRGDARGATSTTPRRGQRGQRRTALGGVPLSEQDDVVKSLVARLELESYKRLLKGLAEFGERRQGTDENVRALKWIEQQLTGWGYKVEHLKYEYRGEPRDELYATKLGSDSPGEMYILGAHVDGIGGGQAVDGDASGAAVVLEIARVLARPEVHTGRSIRFCLWNNEETGLQGARAYVESRLELQGREDPPGSGQYPEPTWLGMIQLDMLLFDHGNPVQPDQAANADVDVEYQLNSTKAFDSAMLGLALLNANRKFASDYPAVLSNAMSNTDSAPFQNLTAAISVRENRRLYEIGRGSNPHWHKATDLFTTYADADFKLGFNAAQTTLAAVATLAEVENVTEQEPQPAK